MAGDELHAFASHRFARRLDARAFRDDDFRAETKTKIVRVRAFHIVEDRRRRFQVDHHFGRGDRQFLAGADVERHAAPALVVDVHAQRDECFHVRIGGDALGIAIAAELPAHDVLRIDRTHRTEHAHLFVARRGGFPGSRRFHCQQGGHLLQVAALLAMEAPRTGKAASSSDEKVRVFRAMRPIDPKDVVRGQFRGYRDTKGVAANSDMETFVALRMYIDNERWSGVPFYIRAGKELPVTATEVMIDLKAPPAVFDDVKRPDSNYFRFRLGPEVVIAEGARVKTPGETMRGERVELIARHHATRNKSPYERLLGDAMCGDNTLFISDECVEAAWAVVDRALNHEAPVIGYEPGSWGPKEAARITAGEGGWHDPMREATSPC